MASTAIPAYFELSWAILSTIGLNNVLVGLMVAGITGGFSVVVLVPLVVSAACALANGLCYYAFYADYPAVNTAVASAFADLAWLIQEAGLSFYSYAILARVLRGAERTMFMSLFWALVLVITAVRLGIMVVRVRFILDNHSSSLQRTVDHLHVGYFTAIAVVECASAVFLLRTFRTARRTSVTTTLGRGELFRYLMRSTEIRLATLALIGVMRAVTYSFQNTAQSAEGVAGQLDRFAYTLECLFPIVMFIDILASRLVFAHESSTGSHNIVGGTGSQSRGAAAVHHSATTARSRKLHHSATQKAVSDHHDDIDMLSMRNAERSVAASGRGKPSSDGASSQEFIIDGAAAIAVTKTEVVGGDHARKGAATPGDGISKSIEFEMHEWRVSPERR